MEFLTLFVLSFTVLLWFSSIFSRRKSVKSSKYFVNRFLPQVKWSGIKLFQIDGYISLIRMRIDGVKMMEKLATKYGRSFQLPFASVKTVVTSDPNLIQKLLTSVKPTHLNRTKAIYDIFLTDGLKDALLAADYEVWSRHRKAISRAFTYKSFPTYFKFINEGAENMVKSACESATQNGEGIVTNENMKAIIDHHVIKITTQIIMGSESFNLSDEEITVLHNIYTRGKVLALGRLLNPIELIPAIWKFHPNKRLLEGYMEEFYKFSYKMADNYRTKIKANANQKNNERLTEYIGDAGVDTKAFSGDDIGVKPFECMVEQMIKADSSNKEIADEVNTFLVGGQETLLPTIDMLIFHLARNTEIQKKCHEEVDQFFSIYPTKEDLNMENISELKYLDRCILEGLRITPTVPFFMRRLDTPLELKENTFIEEGHSILVSAWVLHRDPEIYPNPLVFDPDRFTPENIKKRHPYAFVPFSLGARNCIGWKIGLLEMKIIMAWILRYFEFSTTDEPEDVKIMFDVTLKPERNYNVTFKRRVAE